MALEKLIITGLGLISAPKINKWYNDSQTLHGSVLADIIDQAMKNYNTEIIEPIDKISIVVPTYNEEMFIESAITSIKEQSIIQQFPEYFDLIIVDSGSTDNTVEIANSCLDNKNNNVQNKLNYKIIDVPKGKLSAKNIGIDNSNGNIIVSADADVYYPYHWLNSLLMPFNDPSRYNDPENPENPANNIANNIIGVCGTTFDYEYSKLTDVNFTVNYNVVNRQNNPIQMIGRNCAFYKSAYYLVGKYPENVNQFDLNVMITEEEINFATRLSKLGKIIYKVNASCMHLGGIKGQCRSNQVDKQKCSNYIFGKDRF